MTFAKLEQRVLEVLLIIVTASCAIGAVISSGHINGLNTEIKVLEAQLLACETGKAILD